MSGGIDKEENHGEDSSVRIDDPRSARRREQRRLVWAVIIFLLGAGGVTVAVVYGPAAAGAGLLCLSGGVTLLGLLWAILTLMEKLGR